MKIKILEDHPHGAKGVFRGDVVSVAEDQEENLNNDNGFFYICEDEMEHFMCSYSEGRQFEVLKDQPEDSVDMVNHPPHYTSHPSGVECIQVTEHMNFCIGNAMKYLWRAGLKGDSVEDLEKAVFYINRELERMSKDD